MTLNQQIIDEIVSRVLSVCRADRIILFGSAATDSMTGDSDIDLLVLESAPGNVRKESLRLRQALRGIDYPFDVIVMATDRFEESKNLIGGIAYPANKYGRLIYAAA